MRTALADASENRDWDWPALRADALRETRRILGESHDAEDAAQETMIRAFKSRSRCVSQAAPDGWVKTIARREAYRRFSARRDAEQPLDLSTELDAGGPGPAQIEGLLDLLAARDVLNHVPVADRALLMRRYVLDQSSAQIALDLALPAATVRVRLHRAVKRLREFEPDWS